MGKRNEQGMDGLVPLSAAYLDRGRMLEAFDNAIAAAARDLKRRPEALKSRTITVKLELIPDKAAAQELLQGQDPGMVVPTICWGVKTSLPPNIGSVTRAILKPNNGGELFVSEQFPEDGPQTNIFDLPNVQTE